MKNVNGDEPFAPLDDILKPNEAYWRHLDAILAAAEMRGLAVAISALWVRWGGNDKKGWRAQLKDANARAYGVRVVQVYSTRRSAVARGTPTGGSRTATANAPSGLTAPSPACCKTSSAPAS